MHGYARGISGVLAADFIWSTGYAVPSTVLDSTLSHIFAMQRIASCKPNDVLRRHDYCAIIVPIFAGWYQAEIVQNRMKDPFSPTKWIVSLTKEGLYYLNMKFSCTLKF